MSRIKSDSISLRLQGPLLRGEGRAPGARAGWRFSSAVGNSPGSSPRLSVTLGRVTDLQEAPTPGGVCSGQSESDSVCNLTFRHPSLPVT